MAARFLQISDLDLGARPTCMGKVAETRSQEILETFRSAISFALDPQNRVDGLLIAGNLFDRHRPSADVWAFVRGLFGRLAAAGKPIILIPGSRDSSAYKDSVYRTEKFPGAHVITDVQPGEPIEIQVGSERVFCYGLAPQPGSRTPAFPGFERIDAEGIHIGLLNGTIPDHPEWDLRPRDMVIEPGALSESGLDYFALGGYHGFTPLHLEGTMAAYSGSLEGRAFLPGDLGRKGLLVVEISEGNVTLEQHPISRRTVQDWVLDLSAERITDADGLVAALLARAGEEVIARFTLRGSLEFLCDFDQVVAAVRRRFHHLVVLDETDLLESSLLSRIEGESTIRGYYVRKLLEHIRLIRDRLREDPGNPGIQREMEVARKAVKIGVGLFLEEESATSIGGRESTPEPVRGSNGSRRLEEITPPPAREAESGPRERILIRNERRHEDEMSGEEPA